ncbi:uncharacterized protein TNCV_2612321 [Trichonephila clavipes]|nr:uncharacterized protein TNCV_2612321 [Trichonephila clavipes]
MASAFSDLNPIENVRDALGRQVAGRNYPPTNKNTLIRALTEEWDKLPQQLLDNVVQTGYRDIYKQLTTHPSSQKLMSYVMLPKNKSMEIAPSSDESDFELIYYRTLDYDE